MGSERRQDGQLTAIRIVEDPSVDGRVICIAGGAPGMVRITGFDGVTSYTFATLPYDATEPRTTLWPVITPPDFVKYPAVRFYNARDLQPVDLLSVFSGHLRAARRGFYLWQATIDPSLVELTELELRRALRSPWIDAVQRGDNPTRRILVRK